MNLNPQAMSASQSASSPPSANKQGTNPTLPGKDEYSGPTTSRAQIQHFQEKTKIVAQARRFQSYILNNQIDLRQTCAQLCDPNIGQSLLPNFTNGLTNGTTKHPLQYLKDIDAFVSNGYATFSIDQQDDLFATVSSNMIYTVKMLSQLHPMLQQCFDNPHLKTLVVDAKTLAGHTMVLKKPKHATAGFLFLDSDVLNVKIVTSRNPKTDPPICARDDAMVFKSDLSGRAHVHVDVPLCTTTTANDDSTHVILFMWFFPGKSPSSVCANTMKKWAVDPMLSSSSSSAGGIGTSTSSIRGTCTIIPGIGNRDETTERKEPTEPKQQEQQQKPKTVPIMTEDKVAEARAYLLALSTRKIQITAMQTELKKAENFIATQQHTFDAIVGRDSIQDGFFASHQARDELKSKGKYGGCSFNYGEIKYETVVKTLNKLKIKYGGWKNMNQSGGVFYDLGSGCGNVCIAAALFHPWETSRGIELLVPLHEIALQSVAKYYAHPDSNPITPVDIKHGNILKEQWYKDANVVFCNSLAFEDNLLDALCELCAKLEPGTFLLHSGRLNSKNRLEQDFVCLEFSNMKFSWGISTMWIYQRK